MISFSDWVKKTHGIELDEVATSSGGGGGASGVSDTGGVAHYSRILGGDKKEDKLIKRMAPEPIAVDASGNPKKGKKHKHKSRKDEPPTKTKEMVDDFDDLEESK